VGVKMEIELIKDKLIFEKTNNQWFIKNKIKQIQLEIHNPELIKTLDSCQESNFDKTDIIELLIVQSITMLELDYLDDDIHYNCKLKTVD
jgi:hypothetical protein